MALLTGYGRLYANEPARPAKGPLSLRAVVAATPGRLVKLFGEDAADAAFEVRVETMLGGARLARAATAEEPERVAIHGVGDGVVPGLCELVTGETATFPGAIVAARGGDALLEAMVRAYAGYLFERWRAVSPRMGVEARQLNVVADEARAMVVALEYARASEPEREAWTKYRWDRSGPLTFDAWWACGRQLHAVTEYEPELAAMVAASARARGENRNKLVAQARWCHPATYDAHLRTFQALVATGVR
jgi:hypothetical protein